MVEQDRNLDREVSTGRIRGRKSKQASRISIHLSLSLLFSAHLSESRLGCLLACMRVYADDLAAAAACVDKLVRQLSGPQLINGGRNGSFFLNRTHVCTTTSTLSDVDNGAVWGANSNLS